ncbi:hypothetical protein [Aporhodopirellula aestuarii]|uniref:Cytochrome c domain-containing protein n=1 Tax=Aporhodopirellula aestuarii TaxID=2950107 RepID=A0ABT0U187_9BACT|nr:hypothetical protein [Aporhodopirellula aestuarii]MCM2370330.1 hypothetical protein [Aporhodopirellula aestuarii]
MNVTRQSNNRWPLLVIAGWLICGTVASGQYSVDINLEEAPFDYIETQDDNRVTRLVKRIESKEITLEFTSERGHLESLLAALEIPASSQTLVFSKTSMQVRYISRRNPRAIYFNDDTYVGWVNGSSLVEISTFDPLLGAAFYTVEMKPWSPNIERAGYDCLGCHATSMTGGVPGHTIRSVLPQFDGSVDSQKPSYISSDTSPFSQRWGGWYVTGLHGEMRHMGNAILRGGVLDTSNSSNRMSVRDELDSASYLSSQSDIVALMVLEHQTQMQNEMVKADFFTRKLIHDDADVVLTEERAAERTEILRQIAHEVVKRMLFCDEATLTDPVKGSVVFAYEFKKRGPKDAQGRSLRDFDLKKRLFRYPCSYLIHSACFDALTPCLKTEICRQLMDVLSGNDTSETFDHLDADAKSATLSILRETNPEFRS